jgi:hypothetical protein
MEFTMAEETNDDVTLLDLDNLDDLDVSSFEAAPEFIDPPKGRYILNLTAKVEPYEKDGEDKKRSRCIYSVKDAVELANKKDLVPAEGSMFSETFQVNPEGMKYWKSKAIAILGDLGNSTVGDVLRELNNGVQFVADVRMKTSTGKDADGNARTYENVQVRIVEGDQDPEKAVVTEDKAA